MMKRAEILRRLRATLDNGDVIIGAGCSAGIVAKCAELGGADLIVCYSTGRSRIMGLRTTVIGHSNPRTLDMFDEISNVLRHTPIIAGIEANDQTTYDLEMVIDRFVERGFDGFINFPTVGHHEVISPFFTREHENIAASLGQAWGFAREVELIRLRPCRRHCRRLDRLPCRPHARIAGERSAHHGGRLERRSQCYLPRSWRSLRRAGRHRRAL